MDPDPDSLPGNIDVCGHSIPEIRHAAKYLFQVTYDGNVTLLTQAIYLSKCTIGTVQLPSCLHCFKEKFSRDKFVFKAYIQYQLNTSYIYADGFQNIFLSSCKIAQQKSAEHLCASTKPLLNSNIL